MAATKGKPLMDVLFPESERDDWIVTHCGHRLHLLNPQPDEIAIEDIACGLSHQPRFGGQMQWDTTYTVAQHSCLVYEWLVEHGCQNHVCLAGLLHDSAEAYIGDLSSVLKSLPQMDGYKQIEKGIMATVWDKWSVSLSTCDWCDVKRADRCVLVAEARDGMAGGSNGWKDRMDEPWPTYTIYPMPTTAVRDLFMELFLKHREAGA